MGLGVDEPAFDSICGAAFRPLHAPRAGVDPPRRGHWSGHASQHTL